MTGVVRIREESKAIFILYGQGNRDKNNMKYLQDIFIIAPVVVSFRLMLIGTS
jgi:hypothetical protein